MADSKVSELVTATTLGGSDLLYLVQTNTSKKLPVSTFFSNAGNVTFKGNVNFDSTVQLLAAPGIIDTNRQITHLSVDSTGGSLSIPVGSAGQFKVVALIASNGGTYTLRGNIANSANVVFDNVGDTATLLFTNNKWFVIGGTASIT